MSSSPSVTVELLDAMLLGGGGGHHQQQDTATCNNAKNSINAAEEAYGAVPPPDRVRQLSSLLVHFASSSSSSSNTNNANANNDAGRSTLAAVLLRRAISTLSGPDAASILGEVAEPLVGIFCAIESDHDNNNAAAAASLRRQIGHCIAELCGSLSAASPADGAAWTRSLLGRLEPGCAAADVACLRLLSDIAERSPVSLWSSSDERAIASLLRGFNTTNTNNNTRATPAAAVLEACLAALVQVGIAHERAGRVRSSALDGVAGDVERAILSRFPGGCDEVDPSSAPARLGAMYLGGMLDALVAFASRGPQAGVCDDADALGRCVSRLSACAEGCPSLLAGDESTLSALVRACMSIAQLPNRDDDEDVASLRLAALDVLATVTAVPYVRRTLGKGGASPSPRCVGDDSALGTRTMSPMLRFLIAGHDNDEDGGGDQRGVLYQCAMLASASADDDERAWSSDPARLEDDSASWEDDGPAVLGAESLLESFVENMGGTNALPAVFRLVEILLSGGGGGWKEQRASLSILERCLCAAPATFAPHVPAAVDAALRLVRSAHPRVQYQATQLLGALCRSSKDDCANEDVSKKENEVSVRGTYGRSILEALAVLVRSPCSKVASHACLAVVSYCRGGDGNVVVGREFVVPYVGGLLESLRAGPLSVDLSNPADLMNGGGMAVLIRAVGAVACLADASGEDFAPHYGIVGGLISCAHFGLDRSNDDGGGIILRPTPGVENTHEAGMLRGAAIEAASIVGQAVCGPEGENVEVYANDASEIMTIATTLLDRGGGKEGEEDVIPMDQLLAACARIAAVMGERYLPFASGVLPHILRRASERVEVSVTDDDGGNDDDDGGHAVTIPGMGSKRVRINTTQLEEKAQASRALYEHARALGADFGQFVTGCADVLLPAARCEYSGDVRATSSQALSMAFKCACMSDAEGRTVGIAQSLLPAAARALSEQLGREDDDDEDDIENRHAVADALSEIMWDAHERRTRDGRRVARIAVGDARDIVRSLMSLVEACVARRSALLSEMADCSFDNDEVCRMEVKIQAEADYLTHLVDSAGYQLKMLGEGFAPIFEESIAGPLARILSPPGGGARYDARARLAAVCLLDDCVEHCGSAAARAHAPALLGAVREALGRDGIEADAELKQAAAYGISQVARRAPTALSAAAGRELLMKVYDIAREVEAVSKEDMEHVYMVENSVSAMASLALLRGSPLFESVLDKSALMKVFLCGLPLEQDFDEAKICHDGLCDLVESNMISVQSEYGALIRIVGKILALVSEGEEIASQGTCSRLIGVITKIQQAVDGNMIQAVFSTMEPDVQQALVAAMQ